MYILYIFFLVTDKNEPSKKIYTNFIDISSGGREDKTDPYLSSANTGFKKQKQKQKQKFVKQRRKKNRFSQNFAASTSSK